MHITKIKYLFIFSGMLISSLTFGQVELEDLFNVEVDNINRVYKPIIGIGAGTYNFFGEVHNPNQLPFNGNLGYKVNISTFVDNNHYIRANFFFMLGSMSGNERNSGDSLSLTRNLNFRSNILLFGINLNYDFDNFYKNPRILHPFVSIGLETFTFESKTDLSATIGTEEIPYNYWTDGTIRTDPEAMATASTEIMSRDYTYETDLRKDVDWGQENYPQYAFGIPVDAGFDLFLSDRVMFRVGASYNIVFNDNLDHVSSLNDPAKGPVGNKWGDDFLFTYATIHLDLFSSDKTLLVNRYSIDIDDYDYTIMWNDDDEDGVEDYRDKCQGSPYGVEVDTAGCPLDDDLDGVPNYMDDERNSRYGAIVDDNGVEMSDDDLIARLDMSNAVPRSDIEKYIRKPESYAGYNRRTNIVIPAKFAKIDKDNDNYISYDEMMNAVDGFFDFESDLTTEDIYELNELFFSQ